MPVINVVDPSAVFPIEDGPCSWTVETACCPDWDTMDANTRSVATAWATYILWALTGRQYGPCSLTIRPCGPKCAGPIGYLAFPVNSGGVSGGTTPWMIPWIDNGIWRNCGCTGGCSCSARCEVALPGPVAVIDVVKVDGVVLDPSAYRLDVLKGIPVLVRTDGECWPECQDMTLGEDEVGAFAITYQRGTPVPRAGQIAAGLLACEFAKACVGADCILPQNLASLSRNGVEVSLADPETLIDAGLTGIANVDLWIRSVNPTRRAARSRVFSPDLAGPRFMT